MAGARRIICLTEETVETLYLLGAQDRIVGISGYCVRPPEARREKPRISAFTSARIDKILALKPDLVLTFSDLQAEIARELIQAGIEVHAFNQRTVAGILGMIRTVGGLAGAGAEAETLATDLAHRLDDIAAVVPGATRPRVYFEEWDDPPISAIGWVSELIEIAGGRDIFPEKAAEAAAKDRIVGADQIIARAPEIIIGSWCGKRFRAAKVRDRPGFDQVPAVRAGALHEIKSPLILQPGPAALTDGLDRLRSIISGWHSEA